MRILQTTNISLFLHEVSEATRCGIREETEVKMNRELYVITDAEDLLMWNQGEAEIPDLTEDEAEFITGEMEGYHIELMTDGYGTLFEKNRNGDLFRTTFADVIDEIGNYVHRQLVHYRDLSAKASEQGDDLWNYNDEIEALEESENRLDEIFEKTTLGRQIRSRMRELAAKTFEQVRMIPIISNTIKDDGPVLKPAAYATRPSGKGMVI